MLSHSISLLMKVQVFLIFFMSRFFHVPVFILFHLFFSQALGCFNSTWQPKNNNPFMTTEPGSTPGKTRPRAPRRAFVRSNAREDFALVRLACVARVQDSNSYVQLRAAWDGLGFLALERAGANYHGVCCASYVWFGEGHSHIWDDLGHRAVETLDSAQLLRKVHLSGSDRRVEHGRTNCRGQD